MKVPKLACLYCYHSCIYDHVMITVNITSSAFYILYKIWSKTLQNDNILDSSTQTKAFGQYAYIHIVVENCTK